MHRGHIYVLEKINFNHLRLLTFYQLAITNIPQSHPAVLTSCVEQGGSEESPVEMENVCDYRLKKNLKPVNPGHMSIDAMLGLHPRLPPLLETWQPVLDHVAGGHVLDLVALPVVGELDRP